MDLYSIIACPVCKGELTRHEESLTCRSCERVYPIVNGVPVLLPDGTIPSTEYQHDLVVREEYGPWIPRLIMQSLPASSIILEVGAGNAALDLPNVIRMDVTLTPYTDVVGDAHALPFRPETFDFVFSLAVIEHLRQPFLAAQETFNVLRNGGYVYGDCNFVFAYHGYPHHYFNASEQGLEQVFSQFEEFRTGVAPYQMPSFAIGMVLNSYLQHITPTEDPNARAFLAALLDILDQPLSEYDSLFTEQAALNVAAGVFFFGRKSLPAPSEVIPPVVQDAWKREPELQARFPQPFNLGKPDNIMLWAKAEGRKQFAAIDNYFNSLTPFRKSENVSDDGQILFDGLPVVDASFRTVPDMRKSSLFGTKAIVRHLERQVESLSSHVEDLTSAIEIKNRHIQDLESHIQQIESGRVMKLLRSIGLRRK